MYWGWKPYVSVAQRRAKAQRYAKRLAKQGRQVLPVEIMGRTIATTFWGKSWCENLESYSDFANRLPRGRTYARNGSVIDLQITSGHITALVSGSSIYEVRLDISTLRKAGWDKIKKDCSQSIDSLMDLLQGRFSQAVMQRLTRQDGGLFPKPDEIQMQCSCPDWAGLCKHIAAVLYGVGARLDSDPEMLFRLRNVDHLDLVGHAVDSANLDAALAGGGADTLAGENLGELFGIDLDSSATEQPPEPTGISKKRTTRSPRRKTTAARSASRQASPITRPKKTARKDAAESRAKKSAKKKPKARKQPVVRPSSANGAAKAKRKKK